MAKRHTLALTALACIGWAAATSDIATAAPRDDPRTTEQKVADALAASRNEAATKFLQTFIDSSVGDPKLPKAQKQLHDCVLALAKQWAGDGREGDAARLYLWLADDGITPADGRDAMIKQASQVMTTAMTEAKSRKQYARALQLQKDWLAIYPDKPSPYMPDDLETFAAEGALSALQDKFNQLALPDVLARFYPNGAPLEDLAKRKKSEPVYLGYFRALSDINWAGRFLAEYKELPKDSPVRMNIAFNSQVEKMWLAPAEAWAAQGNARATAEAVATAKAGLVTDSKLALVKAIETKLLAHVLGDPKELDFPGPVKGKVTWQDPGTGYIAKDVKLDDGADITITPGFLMERGSIELQRAKLHLQGTPAQPVVFKDTTITLQAGGRFDAENAVFINCTFSRTGDMMGSRYSSRWTLGNCLLYRSTFSGLGQSGFGLHMSNCAWVEAKIPERVILSMDVGGTYRDQWNAVDHCLFFRAQLHPTTVWMTDECNFVDCGVTKEQFFDSKTPLTVALYVPEADPMGTKLRSQTVVSDKGDLRYAFSRKAYEVGVPAGFWALLPVEGPELPKSGDAQDPQEAKNPKAPEPKDK